MENQRKQNKRIRKRRQDEADAMWAEVERPHNRTVSSEKTVENKGKVNGKGYYLIKDPRFIKEYALTCPVCKTSYSVALTKGVYLSIKSKCPICNREWSLKYWGRIILTVVTLILMYIITLGLFLNAIGAF